MDLVIKTLLADCIGPIKKPFIAAKNKKNNCVLIKRIIVDEKISPNKEKIITDLDVKTAKISLKNALQNGCESVAIVLLHGWKYRKHEKHLENLAKNLLFHFAGHMLFHMCATKKIFEIFLD